MIPVPVGHGDFLLPVPEVTRADRRKIWQKICRKELGRLKTR